MSLHILHVEATVENESHEILDYETNFDITIDLTDEDKGRLLEIGDLADSIDYLFLEDEYPELYDKIESAAVKGCEDKYPGTPPIWFSIQIPREVYAAPLTKEEKRFKKLQDMIQRLEWQINNLDKHLSLLGDLGKHLGLQKKGYKPTFPPIPGRTPTTSDGDLPF